jgi:hypothetical protein
MPLSTYAIATADKEAAFIVVGPPGQAISDIANRIVDSVLSIFDFRDDY